MDAVRLDAAIRAITDSASRRTTLALLLGGLLAPSLEAVQGKGKKKKKCKKPKVRCGKKCVSPGKCQFSKQGKRWSLCADCTVTEAIVLPSGVTLDGRGKTITMSGSAQAFLGAAIMVYSGEATVKNLAIDDSGLSNVCLSGSQFDPGGIFFQSSSGEVDNVTINVRCGHAIAANEYQSAEHTIAVWNSSVTAAAPPVPTGVGINFAASGGGRIVTTVSNSNFTAASIIFNGDVEATVDDCDIAINPVQGLHGADVTVSNSRFANAPLGISGQEGGATLTVTGNTIVGPGEGTGFEISGVEFRPGSSGTVSDNSISNYIDDSPGTGCGIRVQPSAGPVQQSGNTFSNNDQDLCGLP